MGSEWVQWVPRSKLVWISGMMAWKMKVTSRMLRGGVTANCDAALIDRRRAVRMARRYFAAGGRG